MTVMAAKTEPRPAETGRFERILRPLRGPLEQPSWALVAALLILALGLRVALAPRSNLWADETFSLAVATGHSLEHPAHAADATQGDFVASREARSAAEWRRYLEHEDQPAGVARVLRAVLLSDTSPPLYYVLLSGWTRWFGTGDVAVRMFSIVTAVAALGALAGLARRVTGPAGVLGAVALAAFAPVGVYYSIEARMYALLWLLVVLAMHLTLQVQEDHSWRTRVLWVITSAAGFLTHYFFLFPFSAAVLYLALRPGRLRRPTLALLLGAVVLLILPWYLRLGDSLAAWRITQGWLELEPGGFSRWRSFLQLVLHFFSGESYYLWKLHYRANAVVLVVFLALLAIAVLRARRGTWTGPPLLVWLWFAAACSGPLLFDLVQGTYTTEVPRYAAAALPAAYLLAALGLARIGFWPRHLLLGLILVGWLPTLASIFRNPGRSGPPVRDLAAAVSATSRPDDVVLLQSIPSGLLAFARYYDGPAPIAAWVEQLGERSTPTSLADVATGRSRIRYLKYHEVYAPTTVYDWLTEHADHDSTQIGPTLLTDFRPRHRPMFVRGDFETTPEPR